MEVLQWLSALTSIISVIVAIFAFQASRNAIRATHSTEELNQTIDLALARFRENLNKDRLLINEELIDYRFKGEDDKIKALDHRTSRNSAHIAMVLSALLKSGVDLRDLRSSSEGSD